jgi:hypothetical protein
LVRAGTLFSRGCGPRFLFRGCGGLPETLDAAIVAAQYP